MVLYLDSLQKPNGLFYHAPSSPFFWGRGNGWMAAGMTELLRVLPKTNPNYKRIMAGYKTMMESLLQYQAEDGMWRQLINDPESWKETSSTGMFAFALWDQRDETLFLARDRVGKKPLYYSVTNDRYLAFASEIKSLRVWPQFDSTLDPHAIEDFLSFGYVPDPKSIYANVRKLPPGHTLIWTRGKSLSIKPYWNLDVAPAENLSMGEAIDALHAHLRRAVDRRLISDVPLGAFLSGGVDSSAVVSTMARSMTDPVKTFTIGFGVDDYDETAYAREIASRYRTNHGEAIIDPSDIAQGVDTIDRLIDVYDEPFGDNSAIPTMRVCQEARKRVTVALSGDGGDEAFAGYRRYLWHVREQQVRSFVPSSIRVPFFIRVHPCQSVFHFP